MNSFLKKIVGSEDSLFLNIFMKEFIPNKRLPVLVYLYGGGFQNGEYLNFFSMLLKHQPLITGSSSTTFYGPDYLLMSDIIIVTLNYRVGALGFLSLNDEKLNIPGNAGLKDQRLALEFIKNNIANFGGDPENVTLCGQSAGGASVSWHCISKRSKGLFNRAIIMSGCVMNSWALTPRKDWAARLAIKIGYQGNENEGGILEFLQKVDPTKIIEHQKTLLNPDEIGKIAFSFAPQVESFINEDTFISCEPIHLLKEAWSNNIDLLIGGTADEGLMYLENLKDNPVVLANFNLNRVIPPEVDLPAENPKTIEFVENLRRIYYPTSSDPTQDEQAFCKVSFPYNSLFINMIINHFIMFLYPQIMTDQIFWHGLQRVVQGRQNSDGSGKTFLYRFAVDSPTQNHYRIRRLGKDVKGVCHADDVSDELINHKIKIIVLLFAPLGQLFI